MPSLDTYAVDHASRTPLSEPFTRKVPPRDRKYSPLSQNAANKPATTPPESRRTARINVRMPLTIVDGINAHRAELAEQTGLAVSTTAAVEQLLVFALGRQPLRKLS